MTYALPTLAEIIDQYLYAPTDDAPLDPSKCLAACERPLGNSAVRVPLDIWRQCTRKPTVTVKSKWTFCGQHAKKILGDLDRREL